MDTKEFWNKVMSRGDKNRIPACGEYWTFNRYACAPSLQVRIVDYADGIVTYYVNDNFPSVVLELGLFLNMYFFEGQV